MKRSSSLKSVVFDTTPMDVKVPRALSQSRAPAESMYRPEGEIRDTG